MTRSRVQFPAEAPYFFTAMSLRPHKILVKSGGFLPFSDRKHPTGLKIPDFQDRWGLFSFIPTTLKCHELFDQSMDHKKQLACDILALGSIPLYLIVMARALIGPYLEFLGQLAIALLVVLALSYFIDAHMHISRGMILTIIVSMFYRDVKFTIFAFILFGAMLIGTRILKIKTKMVRNALVIGAIAAVVALGTTW